MRLRYDDTTMEKLTNLVKEGKSNSEIYNEFGVPNPYPSLANKIVAIKKELGIPIGRIKPDSVKEEKDTVEDNTVTESSAMTDNNNEPDEDCIKVGGLQVVGDSKDTIKESPKVRIEIEGSNYVRKDTTSQTKVVLDDTVVCDDVSSEDTVVKPTNGVSARSSKVQPIQQRDSHSCLLDITLNELVQRCQASINKVKATVKRKIVTGFTSSDIAFNYADSIDSMIKDLSDLKECMISIQKVTEED